MKRNTNFTNRLAGNAQNIKEKKDYFISQSDVGEVWYSKTRVQKKPENYKIIIHKKNESINFKYLDTKDFVKKLLQQKKSIDQFNYISEIANSDIKVNEQNLYIKYPLLFKNFLKINLSNQDSINKFVSRYGLIGDADDNPELKYRENIFKKNQRIEPLLLWKYEQGCMQFALDLWDNINEPKKLISKFDVKMGLNYKIKSEFYFEENFLRKKNGDWSINNQHSNLKNVSKNLVSLILQDHMEHRISLKTNFLDFNTPTPVLEPDSLIGVLWLQFLKYVQKKPEEKTCAYKECKYIFNRDNQSREFCSIECKNKHHYAESKKK